MSYSSATVSKVATRAILVDRMHARIDHLHHGAGSFPLPAHDRGFSLRRRTWENDGRRTRAGLVMETLAVERLRTAFFDVGAVVYFLRLVPWIVPGFSVVKYRKPLFELPR